MLLLLARLFYGESVVFLCWARLLLFLLPGQLWLRFNRGLLLDHLLLLWRWLGRLGIKSEWICLLVAAEVVGVFVEFVEYARKIILLLNFFRLCNYLLLCGLLTIKYGL